MKVIKYPNLVGEMAKHGDTQISLGKLLNITNGSVSKKLSGEREWTISEIDTICEHYKKDYYELFKGEN